MLKYTVTRLLMMIPAFFGITVVCFIVIHLAPGDHASRLADSNPRATATYRQMLIAEFELDKPIVIQYRNWLVKLLKFDLGTSFASDRRPVADKILERLPVTLAMNVASLAIILLLAVPLGLIAAVRAGGAFDKVTTVFVFICFAAPSFWLALLSMQLFGSKLDWLPV